MLRSEWADRTSACGPMMKPNISFVKLSPNSSVGQKSPYPPPSCPLQRFSLVSDSTGARRRVTLYIHFFGSQFPPPPVVRPSGRLHPRVSLLLIFQLCRNPPPFGTRVIWNFRLLGLIASKLVSGREETNMSGWGRCTSVEWGGPRGGRERRCTSVEWGGPRGGRERRCTARDHHSGVCFPSPACWDTASASAPLACSAYSVPLGLCSLLLLLSLVRMLGQTRC